MSGGAFDYLYGAELTNRLDDIDRMAERLLALGYRQSANDTRQVARLLRLATAGQEKLADIWLAVEWVDSGDCAPVTIADAVRATHDKHRSSP